MSHPPNCNCAACFTPLDPLKMKRLSRLARKTVESLTDKERALLVARFKDDPSSPNA